MHDADHEINKVHEGYRCRVIKLEMIGIDIKHRRELRQLWFAADFYMKEAEKVAAGESRTLMEKPMKELANLFEKGIPKNSGQIEIHHLIAHLSSAAIRLTAIEERLNKGFRRDKDRSQWLHIDLSDNIRHYEPDNNARKEWKDRQEKLDQMSASDIFNGMNDIHKVITEKLTGGRVGN